MVLALLATGSGFGHPWHVQADICLVAELGKAFFAMDFLQDNTALILLDSTLVLFIAVGAMIWAFLKARRTAHIKAELQRVSHSLYLAEKVGGVGTWILNVDDQSIEWSDQVFAIHGRDPSSGEPALDGGINYYHPDDRDRVKRLVERALNRGQSFEFSARLIAEDGTHKSVLSRAVAQTDETGKVIRVFGVFIEKSHVIEIEQFDNDNVPYAA